MSAGARPSSHSLRPVDSLNPSHRTRRREVLLSWRLALGLAGGVVVGLLWRNVVLAIVVGLVVYTVAVAMAARRRAAVPDLDPFTLSEPWRNFVRDARHSKDALRDTLRSTSEGPLRDRLTDIATRLDSAVVDLWTVALRGDQVDAAIMRLDPTRLRSRLSTLQAQAGDGRDGAITSVESQLASADRLKALSASTADRLRLTQARLDELVARAAEVSVGMSDTETYSQDVDDLIIEVEALRLAVAEADRAANGT